MNQTRWFPLRSLVFLASLLCLDALPAQNYFTLPAEQAIDPAVIPPKFQQQIVAKVGKGGVTQKEFEKAQREYAQLMGYAQSPEGGYATAAVTLTPEQKARALYNAIDEEILFQSALAEGLALTPEWKTKVMSEYDELLSAFPELPNDDPRAAPQFISTRTPDVAEFTEERIQAYYRTYPKDFMAAAKLKVKWTNWPSNDEEGSGRRVFARARQNPAAFDEWQGEEWVTEGRIPSFVQESMLPADFQQLYQTKKGAVSPDLRGVANTYVCWVIDRVESTGVRPLDEVRTKVLYRLCQYRYGTLAAIRKSNPERFYRMALNEGVHRRLRNQFGFQQANKHGGRDKALKELRSKFPPQVLLPDPVYARDLRDTPEARQDLLSPEEKAMEQMMRERGGLAQSDPADRSFSMKGGWKEWASWLIWPVILMGGVIFLWKWKNS